MKETFSDPHNNNLRNDDDIKKKRDTIKLSKQANLDGATEQILDQLKLIRSQIHNTRSSVQTRTQNAFDNAKNQIIEITQKIETDIHNIENHAIIIEKELLAAQKKEADKNISFMQELLRKSLHLLSLVIPISYIFFDKETMMMVLVPLMILAVISDLATKKNAFLRTIYLKVFGFLLRKHEIKTKKILLNGASWVMIASVLTIYFFPKIIAVIALSIVLISDLVAAIIGRKYGKTRFLGLKKKSWVGTIAFFVSATIIVTIYGIIFNVPLPFYFIGIIASMVSAFTEAISKKVLRTDDNISIPIAFGIVMWTGNVFSMYFFNIDCLNVF